MHKIPLFLIIVVAIIVIAASFRFVQQRREQRDNAAAPLVKKAAVVSSKREKVLNDRRSRQQMTAPAGSTIRYEVGFKPLAGGIEARYRLSEAQYHQLTVGDKGTLSVRGSQFVAFTPG